MKKWHSFNQKLTEEVLEDPKNYNYIEAVENGKIDQGELKKGLKELVPDATDSEVSDIIAEFNIALSSLLKGNETDSGNPWTLGFPKIYKETQGL